MSKLARKAPWADFAGASLYEGDYLEHPSCGSVGRVTYCPSYGNNIHDSWGVAYLDGSTARLSLQIGGKGMAVKV